MRSKVFQFLFGLALTGSPYFGLSTSLLAQEADPSDIAMWKVRSPQNTIYLLGSIHVGKSCSLDSPRIKTAMSEAEHTVFEIDFNQVTQADQIQLGLDLAHLGKLRPGDRTLKQSVSAATYERIRQKYDELKPPILSATLDTVNQLYRPSFIALQMQGFQTQKLGLSGECGVDKLLMNQAHAAQKNILALETFEQQSKLIQTMLASMFDQSDVEAKFKRILASTSHQEVNTLLTSVMSGDLDTIEDTVTESCQSTPTICYKVLDERNIAWMDQIKTYLQDQDDYFIIVGAAHMIGPNSLITLLENANYQVEPF